MAIMVSEAKLRETLEEAYGYGALNEALFTEKKKELAIDPDELIEQLVTNCKRGG